MLKVSHLYASLGNSPLQPLNHDLLHSRQVRIDIKRDDLLHPVISGNKWRKLKHCLLDIEAQGLRSVAAMGGRYSNFLHSLAYVGARLGWKVTLFIRGYAEQAETPMMQDARRWGANLVFVDRTTFRQFRDIGAPLDESTYWLGEGGFHRLAVQGTLESLMELPQPYDYIVSASATGTTLAGYCEGIKRFGWSTRLVAIRVLKNDDEIMVNLRRLSDFRHPVSLIEGYEFGGYAKFDQQLLDFIEHFSRTTGIPLEPTYSGKAFFATLKLLEQGYFAPGSRVLLLHCGGLQAMRSAAST